MNFTKDSVPELSKCCVCGTEKSTPKVVVSRGNPRARLMVIGEAPGASEDNLGVAFVGRSGKVLDKILERVGINSKSEVFICNVVKCRPPKNRRPTRSELRTALPWLIKQIDLVEPWIIALAGATAVEAVLGLKAPISRIRGNWITWEGRLIMPIFHPSYLLRNPSLASGKPISLTIKDFTKVRNKLNELEKTPPLSVLQVKRP